MHAAIVGAGLAGLATAAALSRAGHQVSVFEQAESLRASGLAFHLWSNATSLLPTLGIPTSRIPGEPLNRMLVRADGREIGAMDLPPAGLPHVTVERAEVLTALAELLPPGTISYRVRCTDVAELAGEHDLVVVADGANSTLREAVTPPSRRRWRWNVWQACVAAELPQIPAGSGAGVIRRGMFVGIFRLTGGRVTWFVELPGRTPGDGEQLHRELGEDPDPVLRTLAAATATTQWTQWRATDIWPRRPLHRGNIVVVGDAAHAMLPPATQGACQAIEDAVALVHAVKDAEDPPNLEQMLRQYERSRIARVRRLVAMGRAGALVRPSNPVLRAISPVTYARFITLAGGPALRRHTRPTNAHNAGGRADA